MNEKSQPTDSVGQNECTSALAPGIAATHSATQQLVRLAFGFVVSQALKVATDLDIPDRLAAGARGVEDLAAEAGAHCSALGRLLRVLAAEGVVHEEPQGVFALTEVGAALRRGAGPRDFVRMITTEPYRAFAELGYAVRTGEPAFEKVFGLPRFDWLAANPEAAQAFQAAMVGYGQGTNLAVAEAYDFAPFSCVADIGGGHGQLLSAILARHSHLSGILLDLPSGVAEAAKGLGGPLPRTRLLAGNFFDAVPQGADLYVIKKVIHDWDDERAAAILAQIRRVLPPGGRVLIAETLVPPGNDYAQIKLVDLNMLVVTGGIERSEAGYAALLARAGFVLRRVIPTKAAIQILEAEAEHAPGAQP